MLYHKCNECGAHLDPCEKCDCYRQENPEAATKNTYQYNTLIHSQGLSPSLVIKNLGTPHRTQRNHTTRQTK